MRPAPVAGESILYSILKACAYLESGGWQVTYVAPNPDTHHIAAQDIIDAVRDDTVLVSVMFVNNETGEILPIKEIVNGVRKRNPKTLIHCDCVQGFGKLPFKLHVYDVDMISASAHKELVRYTFVALIWFFLWSSAEARKEKSIPEQKAFPLHVLLVSLQTVPYIP